MIAVYIRAAREYVEGKYGFLGRALVQQTWLLTIDEFPDDEIKIPLPPLQGVNAVRYDDSAGNEQTVSPDDYYVDTASEPGWVVRNTSASWPTPLDAINAVRVEFIAGYAPDTGSSPVDYTANIPFNIKAAMLLMIADLMDRRNENFETSLAPNTGHAGADRLLRRHKIDKSMA